MKHVVITGASRGLGEALTRCFLDHAWTVTPLVRTEKDAATLKHLFPARCFPIVSDVTCAALQKTANTVLSRLAPVDVLINNAGTGSQGASLKTTVPEDVLSSFQVHCLGPCASPRPSCPS